MSTVEEDRTMRLLPGTPAKDLHSWPRRDLNDIDSSFALQEFLQEGFRHLKPEDPLDDLIACPEDQDSDCWQNEHIRQICQDLESLVALLLPVCNATTCPTMKATDEEQYRCAAHKKPQDCCAIDYILHLLDGTSALLNSNKTFPSRVSIPAGSVKHFQPIVRRLYRILGHAYFQHREVFDAFDAETRMLERFVKMCRTFDLMPDNAMFIPSPF